MNLILMKNPEDAAPFSGHQVVAMNKYGELLAGKLNAASRKCEAEEAIIVDVVAFVPAAEFKSAIKAAMNKIPPEGQVVIEKFKSLRK